MIHDKITVTLQDLAKLREKLKDLKRDVKEEENIISEEYEELKRSYKDLKSQVKDFEEAWKRDLASDQSYNQLREMKEKVEEDIALANQKLFELIAELPPKPYEMKMETEFGPIQVHIQPEMRIYLNGREERRRV